MLSLKRAATLALLATACGKPPTPAECTALLDRYTEKLVSSDRPEVTPGEPLRRAGETTGDAAVRLVLALRDSYLPIQGPPGTGKTFTAARQIVELIESGRTVGITGPSHAVINNLIGTVCECADERGIEPRIGQRAEKDNPQLHPRAKSLTHDRLEQGLVDEQDVRAGGELRPGPQPAGPGHQVKLAVAEALLQPVRA